MTSRRPSQPTTLGQLIRATRERKGISQTELADHPPLCKQMEGPVDRAIGNLGILAPHALEDLTGSEMSF
jgi:hypothetical protein